MVTQATVTDSSGKSRQVDVRAVQHAIGKRGLSMWGGYVREEYLTQIADWTKEAKLYLEMRDDPTVGTLLNAVKLPLLAAEISVKASSENPADQYAAQFLEENLNGMHRQSWRSYTEDALECLDFGFSLGEMILEKRRDGFLHIKNIEPRGQETVRRWITESENSDEVIGFEQTPFRGADIITPTSVPLDKCVHVAYRGRKGNPQGRALLRSLYVPYVFVKNLRTFEGIKHERNVGGTPVVKLPSGIADITSSEFNELRDQLDGLKTDETLYITLPADMEIEPYASNVDTAGIRDTIRDHQRDMLKVFFAQFIDLGMDSAGTQALVKGSQDFFTLALEAVQTVVLEAWNQQLVPFLFRFNRIEGMTGFPEITWAPPGKNDVNGLIEMYATGVNAKVLTATRNDEVWLRDTADLPKLQDDEGQQDRSPKEPQPFGGFGNIQQQQPPQQSQNSQFSEAPNLRVIPGIYEKFTNDYQKDLVGEYDSWARETSRLASLNNKSAAQITQLIDGRLYQLSADLKVLGRRRISEAAGLGLGDVLGKHAKAPQVQNAISELITANDTFIDDSLIPSIKEKALQDVPNVIPMAAKEREGAIFEILTTRRSRVAQSAGGAVSGIFRPQLEAGKIENAQRRAKGEKPIPVKWALDPRAEHCHDDGLRGTFGCVELARVYADGWDALPTVPAGNVSCLGNCRCSLDADFGDGRGWVRVT